MLCVWFLKFKFLVSTRRENRCNKQNTHTPKLKLKVLSLSHAHWVIHILLRSCYFHHNSNLNNKSQSATPSSLVLNEWILSLSLSLSLSLALLLSLYFSLLLTLFSLVIAGEDGERKRVRREKRSFFSRFARPARGCIYLSLALASFILECKVSVDVQ